LDNPLAENKAAHLALIHHLVQFQLPQLAAVVEDQEVLLVF
jgi:hypothetical protein